MKNSSNTVIKIALVGPESTGKSDLAAALALHYNSTWVKEYAREYLNNLKRDYEYADLVKIAKGQIELEEKAILIANENIAPLGARGLLFCDTNLTVIKIWSEFKFGKCDEWITKEIKNRPYDIHLLTDIDLPWQDDPLRENPNNRKELFELYVSELKQQEVPLEIVSGLGDERVKNAIAIIEKLI